MNNFVQAGLPSTRLRPRKTRLYVCAAIALAAGISLEAQWIKHPTPGLPRLADGKPNLSAPAPRTPDGKPDLSGLWSNDGGDRYYNNITADLQVSDVAPWAHEIFMKRQLEFGKDSMETLCLPLGPAYLTTRYREFRIVQTPTLIMMAFVTDRSWLDFGGHPHTEALRITERYTRRDIGRMDVQVTMVDPSIYAQPITFSMPIALQTDTEMLEGFCENHHKSRERMLSTKAADIAPVSTMTLSRYVGTYDTDNDGKKHFFHVTQEDTNLWFDYDGKGKELLVALSPTRFSWTGSIVEFGASADSGMNITIHYVESTEVGTRRK